MSTKEWDTCAMALQMLARSLTCPDVAMCESICDGSFEVEVRDLSDSGTFAGLGKQVLLSDLEKLAVAANEPDLLSALRREYTRLFSAPQGAVVPVWETLFLDPERAREDFGAILIRSKAAADAQRRYEAAGVSMALQESADHMRIECEFASYLCTQIEKAETIEDRLVWAMHLDGFTAAHLNRWFESFFSTLATQAKHPFYRTVAMLGQAIDLDRFRL